MTTLTTDTPIAALRPSLAQLYGSQPAALAAQEARYARALVAFARAYGPGPVSVFRAPGRVNLIGEHTDYNHGYVFPAALDRDVLLLARPRADATVVLHNQEPERFPRRSFAISASIPAQPLGDWANYLQGAAQRLCQDAGRALCGFDGLVDGEAPYGVPREAGLSSSSALTVAAAVTLAGLNDLNFPAERLAALCGEAEWYVGTRGGIMDQFISILGRAGQALFLDCRPQPGSGHYVTAALPLPAGYALVVADSGVRRKNTGSDFNLRVAECRLGVALLRERYPGITHLRDVSDRPWADIEQLLPERLPAGEVARRGIDLTALLDGRVLPPVAEFQVRARCRHVFTENARVLAFRAALEAGDAQTCGRLMNEAHYSARDDYGISTPELEALTGLARQAPGVLSARLTGAGWGGCIVALAHEADAPRLAQELPGRYREATGRDAAVFVCRAGAGAGRVA